MASTRDRAGIGLGDRVEEATPTSKNLLHHLKTDSIFHSVWFTRCTSDEVLVKKLASLKTDLVASNLAALLLK